MNRRQFLRSFVALPLVSGVVGSFSILDPVSRDPLDAVRFDHATNAIWLEIDGKGRTVAELYAACKREWAAEPDGPLPSAALTEIVCPNIEHLWEHA